jgi:membrane protease YdiL (CAAX protease family)
MSNPTEFVITASYCAALGIFALTAATRYLLKPKRLPVPQADPAVIFVTPDDELPRLTPAQTAQPPELPIGRVATWYYQPFDLLGTGFIFLIFFSLAISAVKASGKADMVMDHAGLLAAIAFQFIIAAIVTFFMIGRIRPIDWLGLRWPGWRWVFVIAPGAVLSMWAFFAALQVSGFMKWMESLGVESVQDTVKLLQESRDPQILGLMAFAAVIAAPLCEEIVFRGYFYPATKKFAGPWVAGICSALVFAAAHGSLAALLPLFIFGCLLAFIYEKTGSLWAPIAVHFCFNGATVSLQMIGRYFHLPL